LKHILLSQTLKPSYAPVDETVEKPYQKACLISSFFASTSNLLIS